MIKALRDQEVQATFFSKWKYVLKRFVPKTKSHSGAYFHFYMLLFYALSSSTNWLTCGNDYQNATCYNNTTYTHTHSHKNLYLNAATSGAFSSNYFLNVIYTPWLQSISISENYRKYRKEETVLSIHKNLKSILSYIYITFFIYLLICLISL